jgi:hypothetical protein
VTGDTPTPEFNEVGFFLEISGNPEISELKNSIWMEKPARFRNR